MSDELAAIRERDRDMSAAAFRERWPRTGGPMDQIANDRRTLLALLDTEREARASAEASVAALRETVQSLVSADSGSDLETWHATAGRAIDVLADTCAAAEAHDAAIRQPLEAEITRLRTALEALAMDVADSPAAIPIRLRDFARAALAEPSDA